MDAGGTKPERVEKIVEAICQQWHDRLTEEEYINIYIYIYLYIFMYICIYIAEMQKRKRPILCYSEFRAKALVRQTITESHSELHWF